MVWEEDGKYPNLIIELLSNSTASVDRTVKKELYQNRFRTPEYFWFDPETLELAGFRLIGHQYEDITENDRGWRWSEELGLYLGVDSEQLRYFTVEGVKVPTLQESAQMEQQRANLAELQLERERERAEKLTEQLRALGINPEE